MKINHFVTSSSITLFWDKPKEATRETVYEVLANGEKVGETCKTHFTLEDLESSTSFNIEIKSHIGNFAVKATTNAQKCKLDVTKAPYFAKADGKTLNTAVLQKAIDDCTSDRVLYFPAGTYMTGALRLHSDMEIYLEEGAILQGTEDPEDYLPRIWSRFEGTELSCYSSVLNLGELDRGGGYSCKNVLIHGKGMIASGGQILGDKIIKIERELLKDYLAELGDKIKECENNDTIPGRVRPRLINMSNAQNVVLSGLTFKNGCCWNIHMIYSDNIVTNDCTFISEGVHNGDGWDPDSSTNCTIFGCTFFTGDDSVAIKSGKNPEGNLINKPCRHIRVFDCVTKYGHGICMGSEMSGGIEDVYIWDCDLGNSVYGIEIKGTKKRGGFVRDVHVRDCDLPRILFHSVGYNDDGISAGVAPIFENCSFEGVKLRGVFQDMKKVFTPCEAILLSGFDEPGHELRNIEFSDVTLGDPEHPTTQTLSLRLCEGISFKNVKCL
ncbi:MAG: glycoside hydrolase family 28 protein [Clostridia bacterium]|nr:glycoside hydrolase family 28 protein [Clostridia bacterium]